MTRYYVCGDGWTIREIEPSTGYLLNETSYEVGASPALYEVELNTTENQVTETGIYGNIQLVKHTDDLDPDVPAGENTDDPNAGIIERPEAGAVFEAVSYTHLDVYKRQTGNTCRTHARKICRS